ncbi:MAG: hypothetical protein OEW09_18865, partial [Anaerolineae bacterium]|nr:hypothetical protein [Anaerolineae bacterium]
YLDCAAQANILITKWPCRQMSQRGGGRHGANFMRKMAILHRWLRHYCGTGGTGDLGNGLIGFLGGNGDRGKREGAEGVESLNR